MLSSMHHPSKQQNAIDCINFKKSPIMSDYYENMEYADLREKGQVILSKEVC